MANNKLLTRIVLRNDTTGNWAAATDATTDKLLKGEIGLEFVTDATTGAYTGKVKMKIGDGEHVWNDLPYFGGDECHVFEAQIAAGADHAVAITSAVGTTTLNKGDIAIVKEAVVALEEGQTLTSAGKIVDSSNKEICTQRYQYTAYVYGETADGSSAWKAMDGNYSADNVYFDDDMLITTTVGYCSIKNGQGTIPSKGKNLTQVFETMYVKESNPSTTQPSVSFDSVTSGRYEVGDKVTPSWDAKFSAGSYTYGPATGLTPTWAITDSSGNSASTETGSFTEIQITDNTNYTITAKASYGNGTIPVTNKGNAYAAGQIKASSKQATSSKIYGERKAFYGAFTDAIDISSGVVIRNNCIAKWQTDDVDTNAWCSGDGCTLSIPEGTTQVVVALLKESTHQAITGVYDKEAFGTNISGSFPLTKTTSIPGLNSYTGAEYYVYVYSVPGGLPANTYHITTGASA